MRIPFKIQPAGDRPFDVVGLGLNSVDLVTVVEEYPARIGPGRFRLDSHSVTAMIYRGITGGAVSPSASRITAQCARRYGNSSSTVIPSLPALPRFCRTRFHARARLLRSTTRDITSSSPERSAPWAVGPASPLRWPGEVAPRSSSGSSICTMDIWGLAFP